jgi:N-acetylgalactosamine kinase
LSLLKLIELTKSHLHSEEYTLEEIAKCLEATEEEVIANSLTQNTSNCNYGLEFAAGVNCFFFLFSLKYEPLFLKVKHFQLLKRVLHVFGEAQRVYDFKDACTLAPEEAFKNLGNLMNESHASCRDLYDCSCVELDELTEICRNSGAYGSRLTGWS